MEIRYSALINRGMRLVVREAFLFALRSGKCNFVVSFFTGYPGVGLSEALKKRYPKRMTITLNNQYSDLEVEDVHFGVTLSFGGVASRVTVPFASLISFCDREAQFSLEFKREDEDQDFDADDDFFGGISATSDAILPVESLPCLPDGNNLSIEGGSTVKPAAKIINIDDYLKTRKP